MKIRFDSDYIEGAHPLIIEALVRSNYEQHVGYGCDEYCEHARNIIREHCKDSSLGVQSKSIHIVSMFSYLIDLV